MRKYNQVPEKNGRPRSLKGKLKRKRKNQLLILLGVISQMKMRCSNRFSSKIIAERVSQILSTTNILKIGDRFLYIKLELCVR